MIAIHRARRRAAKSDQYRAIMLSNAETLGHLARFAKQLHAQITRAGETRFGKPVRDVLARYADTTAWRVRLVRPRGIPDALARAFSEFEALLRNVANTVANERSRLRNPYADFQAAADIVRIGAGKLYGRAAAIRELLLRMYGR